jgi:hypothetical protein
MLDMLIANFSFTYVFLFLCLSYFLIVTFITIRNDREIAALGARAPCFRSYLPFGTPIFQALYPNYHTSTICAILTPWNNTKAYLPIQASTSSIAPSEQP